MAEPFHLTFLGTGTSVGVPVIGCDCPVCTSEDPRDRRTRSSVHLQAGDIEILVDSGPDLREQALREGLKRIDAVLYTHAHVDHVAGFDELRAFCWGRDTPLPMHGSGQTLEILRRMYVWAFSPENVYRGYVKPDPIEFDGTLRYGDLQITPLPVVHGSIETHGFLFDHPGHPPIAYIPDVKEIPAPTRVLLRNIDILIVDALRPSPHPTHMSVAEALAEIESIGASRAWLTHLGHENGHAALEAILPPNIRVAYDGLRIPGF
ncbi:MBL fold metallo-hydrolase [Haloferula helveola]|uniref:MBL fold metallo-hydrolase n=1 Tax=Haloferula helveola TaxID=490095 RepID=A0ABN6H5V3_9BACT|nr:MBL fold metallo-hydrolase [Haloferula helveola]